MKNSKTFQHAQHVILNLFQDLVRMNVFTKVFVLGLVICFLAEGIGIVPKNVLLPLFLAFSLCLLVPRSFSEVGSLFSLKSKSSFSGKNMWIFIGVLFYVLYLLYISSFSLNRQISFELLVYLFSLLLLFIVALKHWGEIEKPFLYSILGLGIFFCIYSVFLPFALSNNLFQFYPQSGYQYVYSLFGNHNHLGDFLVFPLLISFYLSIKQKKKVLLSLFFLYLFFFLFSYSRSAYIGFFIGFVLLCFNYRQEFLKKQRKFVIGFILGMILFFFLLSSNTLRQNNFMYELMHIIPSQKSVVETREEYVLQGLKGFLTYRYYGVGLSNFEYGSRMFTERPGGWTASSHNIFMDVLVETGTFSFVIFVLFVILLLKTMKKNHMSIFAVLLLSWFVMVQFDYIHRMYSYLFLFPLFLVGLLYSSRQQHQQIVMLNSFQHLISFFLCIFLIIYITSGILLHQENYKLSRKLYPLQIQAYTLDLGQKEVVDAYTQLFPGEYLGFYQLGKRYEREGDMRVAIENYEKSFWLEPFRDLPMAGKIYDIKLRYQDEKSAKRFADKLFIRLNNDTEEQVLGYNYWLFVNKFCQKVYNLHCPYTLQ